MNKPRLDKALDDNILPRLHQKEGLGSDCPELVSCHLARGRKEQCSR